ncbi:ArsR/SmtB family transcription factor [Sphingomonas phyllosphaerae]|uniref:ArsR/SmtB family transcription factor n=1 Tax=Sphingomonas phyllosphaerae TaxID=257003 RepID=UPI002413CCC2|nr:metalloregulator ArsR/SmtB family transcription factor [Sphingomonas phyllosphaerae]
MARPRRKADAEPIDLLLQALGDPTRRRMIERLGERPQAVSALADLAGITLTAVGQHIRLLEEAGLVTSSKLGRVRSCQLNHDGLKIVEQWLSARRSAWDRRLDALGAVLSSQQDGER